MRARADTATVDWIEALARAPLSAEELLQELRRWAEQGWLRRLDEALARFVMALQPQAPALLPLCAALVAHLEGRGHVCLPLEEVQADLPALLAWPPEAQQALDALRPRLPAALADWLQALRASPLVAVPGVPGHAARGAAADADTDTDTPAGDGGGDGEGGEGGEGGGDVPPLVLDGTRLYLRRYWRFEQRVAAQLRARGDTLALDAAAVRAVLERLFPPGAAAAAGGPDWQRVACAVALRSRLSVITGGPGTGKTYTVARLLAALLATAEAPERLRIALAAPTGKAAARLKQSIEGSLRALADGLPQTLPLAALMERIGAARTLHALLGARPDTRRFAFGAGNLLDVDVLIVDEASMVHLEMMDALLDALPAAARLVLLGDKDQLASVEAGAVLGDLCGDAEAGGYDADCRDWVLRSCGQALPAAFCAAEGASARPLAQRTVMLRQSRRFGGPIGQLAAAVNRGDAAAAQRVLLEAGRDGEVCWLTPAQPADVVRLALQGRAGADGGYAPYLEALRRRPEGADVAAHADWVLSVLRAFERFRVLCALREGEWGVQGLNAAIEAALARAGLLKRSGEWYEGRPVMVTRNQPALGVFNGDIGLVLRAPGARGAPRVYFPAGEAALHSVLASRLPDVETAFALTVHKSQGSEFEHTVLALPAQASQLLTRELAYTGLTRARRAFTLVSPEPGLLEAALAQRTRRASGLAQALADPAPRSP